MHKYLKTIILILMTLPSLAQQFKNEQLKFERVKNAYDQKWAALQHDLKKAGFDGKFELYIAAYKNEGKLELWLKRTGQSRHQLFKTYDFCAHSGTLGPKLIEGDGQTPEGFYQINVFNPQSSYHLSLGLDYPNKVDVIRTGRDKKPGSDIYIHGDCVTIGCIPLNEKIKEVYILAVEARNGGQREIPVYIFPFKMNAKNLQQFGAQFPAQISFWNNLQEGYSLLEQNRNKLKVKQVSGVYVFSR